MSVLTFSAAGSTCAGMDVGSAETNSMTFSVSTETRSTDTAAAIFRCTLAFLRDSSDLRLNSAIRSSRETLGAEISCFSTDVVNVGSSTTSVFICGCACGFDFDFCSWVPNRLNASWRFFANSLCADWVFCSGLGATFGAGAFRR